MKKLFILGCGGMAKELSFAIEEINRSLPSPAWDIVGYISDESDKVAKFHGKYKCVGNDDYLLSLKEECALAMGIGTPSVMRKVYEKYKSHPRFTFPNLYHPSVVMDRERCKVGEGNLFLAGTVFTTDIQIGSFNIFNRNTSCGHDSIIGDFCVVNPGSILSGGVVLEGQNLVGVGASILQYLRIGKSATVGAGAVVTKNVDAQDTVVGVPARSMTRLAEKV